MGHRRGADGLTPQQRYHAKNRDDPAYREKVAARKRAYYLKLKTDVIEGYGGKCTCCGETERAFLCIDHINGGGRAHRDSYGQGRGVTQYVYRDLRRRGYPEGYQVLCANCNMAKERPEGCPHQRESV